MNTPALTRTHLFDLIEPLEARIAPAVLVNPTTVSYTDVDGDTVIVKTTKGVFGGVIGGAPAATDFIFAPSGAGEILQRLELSSKFGFQGAKISVTATTAGGGNGFVNVGRINAFGVDLGGVTIDGDLGRIDAGDSVLKTAGLGFLKTLTLGAAGTATQEGIGSLVSNIQGKLGELSVTFDVFGSRINVLGGHAGTVGKITIGGSLFGGSNADSGAIIAEGNIGPVIINGDLQGFNPGATGSGSIRSEGSIASIRIGGNLEGGAATGSGVLRAQGNIGPIFIGGYVKGGAGTESGYIETENGGNIASVTILGSLIGGGGTASGRIHLDSGGLIGPVKIGTNVATDGVFGGAGTDSGSISVDDGGNIASVTISGSLAGGAGNGSGSIEINDAGQIGPVVIKAAMSGGSGVDSGTIHITDNGSIASVTIGGSLLGGSQSGSGSIQTDDLGNIGPVKIGGAIIGGSGAESGLIRASGGSIKSVTAVDVVGGTGTRSGSLVSSGDLGPVTISATGRLVGGAGTESGSIISQNGDIVSVRIATSVIGGDGNVVNSGVILAENGDVRSVFIGGNLVGGNINVGQSATNTGAILGQNIGTVTIIGSIFGGGDFGNTLVNAGAVRAEHQLKSLTVNGNVAGNLGHFVNISGRGQTAPTTTTDLAIGSIKIGGDLIFTNIVAGVDQAGTPLNPDAQIGSVFVTGSLAASNIAAGVVRTDAFFGNLGDASIVGTPGADTAIISRIASITIGGSIDGTLGGGDTFGFVAEHVVKLTVGGFPVALTAGPRNDLAPLNVTAVTGDVFVLEVI